jgi:hypothetical protein
MSDKSLRGSPLPLALLSLDKDGGAYVTSYTDR